MKKFSMMFMFLFIFYGIAVSFWLIFDQIFYLLNFAIIGTSLGLGLGLWPVLSKKKRQWARRLSQLLVGGYMFFGLGLGMIGIAFGFWAPENMQIEGFWFMLFSGYFAAAVMHYAIAKLVGPFLFNRAWCGWACWTVAVLDFLPWKKSPGRLPKKYGFVRYLHFAVSALLVFILIFLLKYNQEGIKGYVDVFGKNPSEHAYANFLLIPELWWFIIGNAFYYGTGLVLAFLLKDNRAFCKYLCPITVFLKAGAHFSAMRIKGEKEKCTNCRACERSCPMDIKISEYVQAGKRVKSSECIICQTCTNVCPENILSLGFGIDVGFKERLRYRKK